MASIDQERKPQKSWVHAVEKVSKTGYADGASEGQDVAFQSSFDMGYQQGLYFGFKLGFNQASQSIPQSNLNDRRMINCQICINGTTTLQNTGNLYNLQQEKNVEFFENHNC